MSFQLRKHCDSDIIDYNLLMSALKDYKAPHRMITHMIKKSALIRIKKGLYVFGDNYRQQAIPMGLIANLIYGPSYVSLEYALAFHGMIPERVEMVTSITTKRNKLFNTPIGNFSYSYLNHERYSPGIQWYELENKQHFLIASPEKALIDTVAFSIWAKEIRTIDEMQQHLLENLRVDEYSLRQLNLNVIAEINQRYKKPIISLLNRTLQRGI
jgi:predicted transcriptional regulator of viral defense system